LIAAMAAVLSAIWFCVRYEARMRADPPSGAHAARQATVTPVQSRSLVVGAHELVVLDVQAASAALPLVERQRCYVWRDTEFQTASLACQTGDDASLPPAPPPPSFER
jgi:hypothetical protein